MYNVCEVYMHSALYTAQHSGRGSRLLCTLLRVIRPQQWSSPHHNNAEQVREAGHVWSVVVKIGILNTRKDLLALTQWILIFKQIT